MIMIEITSLKHEGKICPKEKDSNKSAVSLSHTISDQMCALVNYANVIGHQHKPH